MTEKQEEQFNTRIDRVNAERQKIEAVRRDRSAKIKTLKELGNRIFSGEEGIKFAQLLDELYLSRLLNFTESNYRNKSDNDLAFIEGVRFVYKILLRSYPDRLKLLIINGDYDG
jgi:hypothetical protein